MLRTITKKVSKVFYREGAGDGPRDHISEYRAHWPLTILQEVKPQRPSFLAPALPARKTRHPVASTRGRDGNPYFSFRATTSSPSLSVEPRPKHTEAVLGPKRTDEPPSGSSAKPKGRHASKTRRSKKTEVPPLMQPAIQSGVEAATAASPASQLLTTPPDVPASSPSAAVPVKSKSRPLVGIDDDVDDDILNWAALGADWLQRHPTQRPRRAKAVEVVYVQPDAPDPRARERRANRQSPWQAYDPVAWETAEASYSHTRLPADASLDRRDCEVCTETKTPGQFPRYAVSGNCLHPPNTCLDCMRTHIKTELASNVFHDNVVRCPECGESLSLQDIQMYADAATFTRSVAKSAGRFISTSPQRAHPEADTRPCSATAPWRGSPTSSRARTRLAARGRSTIRASRSPSSTARAASGASASGTAWPGTRP